MGLSTESPSCHKLDCRSHQVLHFLFSIERDLIRSDSNVVVIMNDIGILINQSFDVILMILLGPK